METEMIYLKNRDMLREIHLSKKSYSSYVDSRYEDYDYIIENKEDILDPEIFENGKLGRLKRLTFGESEPSLTYDDIKDEEVVFRWMTYEHVPEDLTRKKTKKVTADSHVVVNFPPFQHVILDGDIKVVGKSHWKDGLENGFFSTDHGKMTDTLTKMFVLLVDRYSMRGNWRNYSYNDEMCSGALLQLAEYGLKFNESKSNNPFAFYTRTLQNSFTGTLLKEKREQKIKDEYMIENGLNPSHNAALNHEIESRKNNG